MKRSAPRQRLARASLSWRGVGWTLALALCWLGLHDLAHHHAFTARHLMILIFLAAPLAAFMLSGGGQDSADEGRDRDRGDEPRAG